MNRSDIVRATAQQCDKSVAEIDHIANVFFQICEDALVAGQKVKIRRWGVFEPRTRGALTRVNPRTHEVMDIPDRNTVAFLPSDLLKARLNGETGQEPDEDE